MRIYLTLMAAAMLVGCSRQENRDLSYNSNPSADRRAIAAEKEAIDDSVKATKEQIDADARFQKDKLEADAKASKEIIEAERERAAALARAQDRRADATDRIDEPAGAEVKVRVDTDSDLRLRSSLGLQDKRDITVHIEDGKVTLKGNVASAAERADLEAKAKAFPGVTRVDNRLEVRR